MFVGPKGHPSASRSVGARAARAVADVTLFTLVVAVGLGCAGASGAMASVESTDIVGTTTVAQDPGLADVAPDVEMEAGLLATTEGRVLWARNPEERRAIASLTKVMTALVVLEEARLDEEVVVSSRAASVGGSGIYLRPGERLEVGELLAAVLLESSNAAAEALAEHVGGSEARFVEMMNERAARLGMDDTHFSNPHGLNSDGHLSTARDLLRLTLAALEEPTFARLVSTATTEIPGPSGTRLLENSNELIGEYEGAFGVKTGWTDPAGYCLIAGAARGDVGLIAVVLGADDEKSRFTEAAHLLDWGFEHYKLRRLVSAEETVSVVRVLDYPDRYVGAVTATAAAEYLLDTEGEVVSVWEAAGAVGAPVRAGDRLGRVRVYQGDDLVAEVDLVAAEDVPEPTLWQRIGFFFERVWERLFASRPVRAACSVRP
ncbi:MAG: D-alanyl-D-alanine carboxypeptidase family protein [Coriobacteriia bacterium]